MAAYHHTKTDADNSIFQRCRFRRLMLPAANLMILADSLFLQIKHIFITLNHKKLNMGSKLEVLLNILFH